MKIAYKSFISATTISEYPIYLILGNPYHLQNEVEFRLENYYKKKLYVIKKYVVDSDFDPNWLSKENFFKSIFNF